MPCSTAPLGLHDSKRRAGAPLCSLAFPYASDTDLKTVAHRLEQLGLLRNQSDYELESPGPFASDSQAVHATRWGRNALMLLDGVDNDIARRGVAIASIRKAFP
jgi:hypothetical protein